MQTPKSTHKSKKSGSSGESPRSPFLSPVAVSPGRSPGQGNLTGIPRQVKDAVADWYNYSMKWDSHNSAGAKLLSSISNIKLHTQFDKQSEMTPQTPGMMPQPEDMMSQSSSELQELSEALMGIIFSMEKIALKFEALTGVLKGVCELEQHQNGGAWHPDPLFITWNTHTFYDISDELCQMYRKELNLKRRIAENVCHCDDRDLHMLYSSSWLHQPYIETRADFLMDSMLTETGHSK